MSNMSIKGLSYVKSAERWQRYGEEYHQEARQYYGEVNKTALTLATFLLGFIGVFLQLHKDVPVPTFEKTLLIISFIALIISVIAGLRIFIMMNEFLNKSGDYYEELSENLHEWMLKNLQDYGPEYPTDIYTHDEVEYQAGNTASYVQLGTLAAGFVSIAVYFLITVL